MAVELLDAVGTTQTLSLAKRIMEKNNRIKLMKSSVHDRKSGLEPVLQPNAAFIALKSGEGQSKESDSTSKWSFYCSLNRQKSGADQSKEVHRTSKCSYYCSPMQPFIALKLGEGRTEKRQTKTRNFNGGATSRNKDKVPETTVMANAKLSDSPGRRSFVQ
jgi:hypothetical protein